MYVCTCIYVHVNTYARVFTIQEPLRSIVGELLATHELVEINKAPVSAAAIPVITE